MTDPMELVGEGSALSRFGHQAAPMDTKAQRAEARKAMREAAACIREMVEKSEALKRSVERYRDQVTIERKAYRKLLADHEGRPLPPAPGAEDE